jgi:hypothetical protein
MAASLTPAQLAAMAAAQMVAQRTEMAKKQVRVSPAHSRPRVYHSARLWHGGLHKLLRLHVSAAFPARRSPAARGQPDVGAMCV